MIKKSKFKKIVSAAAVLCVLAALFIPGRTAVASSDNAGYVDTSEADNSGSEDTSETGQTGNEGPHYIDTDKNGTLTIYYHYEGYGVTPGVNAHIYRLASVSEDGEFNVLAPFAGIGLDLKDMNSISTSEQWKAIIDPATAYIKEHNVEPYASAVSDSEGYASLGTVETGLYMGVSDPVEIDGVRYVYCTVLAPVPGPVILDEHGTNNWDGTWADAEYDVIAIPKRETIRLGSDPEEYTVYKQWVDTGYAKKRPKSIEVEIYCDGELFETVKLSSSNNWQYSWKYEKGHTFTLKENVDADKYTVNISQNETSYVIVNTRKPEKPGTPPDDEEEGGGGDNGSFEGGNEDYEGGGDSPSVLGAVREFLGELPAVLGARRLPQTGQLWWPVPVLALLGLIFIGLGFRSEKRRKSEN